MSEEIDITGKRFGRLIAICKSNKKDKWLFKCDCGKEKEILKYNVIKGATKSCGCLETESRKLKNKREKNPEKYIGLSYNNLTIKNFDHYNKNGQMYFLCSCLCGKEKIVRHSHLKSGEIKSCGCLIKKNASKKHGLYSTNERLAKIWSCMIGRCNNIKNTHYNLYGGRGIKVCQEWKDASNFQKWAINNGYKDDLTIDRIDVNGNYEPSNCRWVSMIEQARNKRNNHYIVFNGDKKCLAEWLEKFDRSDAFFYYWKKKGLTDSECVERMARE